MDKVVSENQHAFVERRQIQDAALVANEVVYVLLFMNEGVLYKLDMEKAYDYIN